MKTVFTTLVMLTMGLGMGTLPAASADTGGWTRQFGTAEADEALGVALDGAGDAYVAGWALGTLPGQVSAGMVDAFVRKYDAAGHELWSHQFGSSERDFARSVATDGAGNAYVVGETYGTLPGQASAGGYDAFVRKYDAQGRELWTRQFGSGGGEGAWGVAVEPAGVAYVVGTTRATLPAQASAGDFDAFVRKYDPAGHEMWTRQFGGSGGDGARAVALDGAGNALVVGSTDGALPGQTSTGGFDAYVRQYDATGKEVWTRQFGSVGDDYGVAVAVDPAGRALVAGSADDPLPGQAWAGGTDAFVRSFDTAGTPLWTREFGTETTDDALGVAIDGAGRAYVVGSTERNLPGKSSAGGSDVFVRQYDSTGNEAWTRQLGSEEMDVAFAVVVDGAGRPRLAGSTRGALPGQTSAGSRDAFVMSLGQ